MSARSAVTSSANNGKGGRQGVRPLSRWMRGLLYATCVLFVVNGIQLLFLSGDTAAYFAWTLEPLAGATLGAAFFGLAAGQFVAARQRTWAEARVAVPWLWVLSGLLLVLTLLHSSEFHFSSPDPTARFAAWFWVATFAGIALATDVTTWAQLRKPGGAPPGKTRLPHALRIAFLLEAVLIGIPGAIYLLVPRVFFSGWLYPPTELAIQATGAGFVAIGVLAFSAYRENDIARVRPIGGLFTVFAVLELIVIGLNAGAVDWSLPLAWVFVVLLLTLLDPGTHALFGRKVLRLRAGQPEPRAETGSTSPWSGAAARHVALDGDRPWFRLWPPEVPKTLDYPEISVPELMHRAARRHPDRVAYRFFGRPMTYGECEAAIDRFAAGLRKIGVHPGDRVSLMLLTTPHFPVVLGGVLQAGGIVVQTNPLYTPHELEHLYNAAGVVAVVTMDLFWPTVAKAKPNSKVSQVVVCDMADFLGTPMRQLYTLRKRKTLKKAGRWPLEIPREAWVHRFSDIAATPSEAGKPVPMAPDDVALLQYTGGTTGVPRGAMLTHRNLVAAALQSVAWMGNGAEHNRWAGSAAPFHVSGLIGGLQLWVTGDENLLAPDPRDFRYILKLAQKWKATHLAGPPAMYIGMLRRKDFPKYDLSSLKLGYSTSAPMPREVRAEFERRAGCPLFSLYGLTESCPAIGNPLQGPRGEGVGIPYPDTDAAIVAADDPSKVLPPGEVGELAIRGPQVTKGYWNEPEATGLILKDGWLLTGDIATMGDDGYFRIMDRKKDMINAYGYKVYPAEVEDVLFTHPGVAEAAVIGVPDPDRGEAVKAFIVRKAGATVTDREIVAFCQERLAPVKVPTLLEFVPDLPKSYVGKVLRRELRERERAKARTTS